MPRKSPTAVPAAFAVSATVPLAVVMLDATSRTMLMSAVSVIAPLVVASAPVEVIKSVVTWIAPAPVLTAAATLAESAPAPPAILNPDGRLLCTLCTVTWSSRSFITKLIPVTPVSGNVTLLLTPPPTALASMVWLLMRV